MNKAVFSCAGSRKTTIVVEEAIELYNAGKKIIILTYTITNKEELELRVVSKLGFIPKRINIQTWLSFLVRECIRPYQNIIYNKKRIKGVNFVQGQSAIYANESSIKGHFITQNENLYSDKISKFVNKCNKKGNGKIIKRLEQIADYIFIDEVQDLASYDLDLVAMFFKSNIKTIVVGDVRQVVYTTHHARRLRRFRKEKAIDFYKEAEKAGLCSIEERTDCFRSIQCLCDFADSVYPELPKTTSKYIGTSEHQGIFTIKRDRVLEYYEKYSPKVLRHSIRSNTMGLEGINFGKCKGKTYERVLIFPTKPIKDYLSSGDISAITDRHKFYVSITRAKESIAFVYDENSALPFINEYK
jgi:DNA helicase-2/ATP-dependent DNA helicase PcrA